MNLGASRLDVFEQRKQVEEREARLLTGTFTSATNARKFTAINVGLSAAQVADLRTTPKWAQLTSVRCTVGWWGIRSRGVN